MAKESISLFESAGFKDQLRELVQESLAELMELEVRSLTGAGYGERSCVKGATSRASWSLAARSRRLLWG
jgi:hypothetical protein